MPSAEARKNHDELFPGRVSTLAVTDPELIEYFDNWAFDEVPGESELDTRTRLMVQLAAMIAGQAVAEYRVGRQALLGPGDFALVDRRRLPGQGNGGNVGWAWRWRCCSRRGRTSVTPS